MMSEIPSITLIISCMLMFFEMIELIRNKQKKKTKLSIEKIKIALVIPILTSFISFGAIAYSTDDLNNNYTNTTTTTTTATNITSTTNTSNTSSYISLSNIPQFTSSPYTKVNNGNPYFSESDLTTSSFEKYSNLDSLGRCGVAYACIGKDLMPTEKREPIGSVKPSGWHTIKYDGIDGKYLYNRCHLIGYQLTGENANQKNLITGTRYLNTQGMLPFENMVADYIKETSNHVMYRVTPVFEETNLVASGVLIEAESVEDNGNGIKFNVYCYNVEPGITINYANGESSQTSLNSND